MERRSLFVGLAALTLLLALISIYHNTSYHDHSVLLDRYASEIERLEKEKVALDHDLASVNRRSVPRPKRAPIRLPRFAHTQDLIKKLKSEKQALELELSHGHKSPIAKPSAPPQKIVLKSRVSHIDSRKKERELKNLLHQQDVLETKMSAFDQQDDPAIQAVFAEHFARNPGLLDRVPESTQNVLGSLAASHSPPAKKMPDHSLTQEPSDKAKAVHEKNAAKANRIGAMQMDIIADEVDELKRLKTQIFRAVRALSSAAAPVLHAKGSTVLHAKVARPARRNQVLTSSEQSEPESESSEAAEVNPEEQLQGLKKLAREWIGYKGGLAPPPAAVLCPPLSPQRFRGECHAEGYVPDSVVVGATESTGPDRFGAAGAGPQVLKGKLGDNVIGVGLLGEAGTDDDDNMLPAALHNALGSGPSRDPKMHQFGALRDAPNRVLEYGTLFAGAGLGDFDDHVPASDVSSPVY